MLSALLHSNGGPIGAKASVSSKHIVAGNIVELKIRARGKHAVFPIIEKIDGIKVLRQHERVTNIHTFNNGKFERERTTLVLTFAPQKDMTIPSYKVEIEGKYYKTKAIKLTVKDPDTAQSQRDKLFTLKLTSNKKSLIVGETFLLTIHFSLKHGVTVAKKPQYNRPTFKGFFVEEVDKRNSYDEGDQQITELTYILTAHSEGNFTLGPAEAKIGLRHKDKKEVLNAAIATMWIQKASNTLDIEVLPKALESDLVGEFTLNATIDRQEVKANKPVNLTVTIKGEGNLINFDLPDYALDAVTVYSDDAKVETTLLDGKIHSSYSKKFVFISENNFSIPESIFSMYDPKAEQLKVLKIKAYPIEVQKTKTMPKETSKTSLNIEKENSILEKTRDILSKYWWILLLSVMVPALLFYLISARKNKVYSESEALTILYGHISKGPEVEEMVRKLYARKHGDTSVEIDMERVQELIAYCK